MLVVEFIRNTLKTTKPEIKNFSGFLFAQTDFQTELTFGFVYYRFRCSRFLNTSGGDAVNSGA